MLSLSSLLEARDLASRLPELERMLYSDQCQPRITFWGSRVVKNEESGESFYLDSIVKKVFEAAVKRRDDPHFSAAERLAGRHIIVKLNGWYDAISFHGDHKACFVTQLLYEFWNRYLLFYTPQFFKERKILELGAGSQERVGFFCKFYYFAVNEDYLTPQLDEERGLREFSAYPQAQYAEKFKSFDPKTYSENKIREWEVRLAPLTVKEQELFDLCKKVSQDREQPQDVSIADKKFKCATELALHYLKEQGG